MKYYVGLDLGGTAIKTAIIDEEYNIIAKTTNETNTKEGVDAVVAKIANCIFEILKDNNIDMSEIEHIGFGVPSSIDGRNNHVIHANNMGWKDLDLVSYLKKHIDKELYIANDADCAVYGEVLCGVAKDLKNVVMLTLGTGVGGGLVWDGKIFKGGEGSGSEPGHIIVEADGRQCTCGRKGCLEAYSSVTGLIKTTKEIIAKYPNSIIHEMIGGDESKINGKTPFLAKEQGDEAGIKIVDEYIKYLAIGISNFVCLLHPQAVIIGGGLSAQGENLLVPIREIVDNTQMDGGVVPHTPILKAKLGNDAGLIGAAFLGKSLNR